MVRSGQIYVVEDDDELREWLSAELRSQRFTVESFPCGQAFVDAIGASPPGCVLADLRMPDGGALKLLKHLSPRWREFPVVVMTAYADVAIAVAAMKQGAVDFIEKPFTLEAIVKLIGSVQRRIDCENKRAPSEQHVEIAGMRLALLTAREHEVLEGLVMGYPNKKIANELDISTRTVEVYRARILKKMEVRNVAQLVSMVLAAEPDIATARARTGNVRQVT